MTYPLFDSLDRQGTEEKLKASFENWVVYRASSSSKERNERGLGARTANVYQEMWNAFAAYCADRGLTLDKIGVEDLEIFLETRGASDRNADLRILATADELSARYARRLLMLIDRIMRFEAKSTHAAANTAAHELLQRPLYRYAEAAHKDPLPEYLNASERNVVIAHVTALQSRDGALNPAHWKEVRDRTAIALMLGGGLAPGDVRALRLDGVISMGGRRVNIPWKLALPGNGNGPARETPLAEWAGAQLAFWLKVRAEQGIFGDFIFPSTAGGRVWSHTRCFEACKAVLECAGITNSSGGLFKLRHTFAIRQLGKGKPEAEVARWLGLTDVSGMERYRRVVHIPVDVA